MVPSQAPNQWVRLNHLKESNGPKSDTETAQAGVEQRSSELNELAVFLDSTGHV